MPARLDDHCPPTSQLKCQTTTTTESQAHQRATHSTTQPHPPQRPRRTHLVSIGRNDNRLSLYNGTRAVVTAVDVVAGSLTLRTDDERDVTVSALWAAQHDLSHAYAMTLHKAQGLTVDHALLYGSEALTREAGYVGLSRGRRENHVYATTREMAARSGECDFAKRDPIADEQRPITDLARRLQNSRTHQLASQQQPEPWRNPRVLDEYTRTRSEGLSR
jgi:ATP-dependent exoDNAse (exonuclease V) alpha subunit